MAEVMREEPDAAGGDDNRRALVRVRGIVQGVGFRPYIFQLAHLYGLGGRVSNQADGVEIVITGSGAGVGGFLHDLPIKAPPLAKIVQIEVKEEPFEPIDGFTIVKSVAGKTRATLISPDVCTCGDCLREFSDPKDRRYRYPFTNCTNCGPRYTIIRDIPYDRDKTTMAAFPMCPECRTEYEDPMNRRFHAQPNACWECGPQVWLETPDGSRLAEKDEAVNEAIRQLVQGAILAVKGLGGFHLAVHALDEAAVSRLRSRKVREEKPFAVMFSSMEAVRRYCRVNAAEEKLLTGLERPIVLLERLPQPEVPIAATVAPRNRYLGAFLPYTPLHYLLFAGSPCDALIMTSGNQSDEPIVVDNESARRLLGSIADFFLLHDRDIYLRCDDSVTRIFRERPYPLRRARGYVPVPVFLAERFPPVLGVGAELKNTVCLVRGNEAFLSQHIGDLENLETLHSFERVIDHLKRILETEPLGIVHDLHPNYLSTQWALGREGVPLLAVQHHHAHIASVMAERRLSGPVLGLALDGTGYGTDGTIWGGEILRVDGVHFERLGHFRHVPLPGGDRAIKEPWRTAVSCLWSLERENAEESFADILKSWDPLKVKIVLAMLRRGLNSPLTSSCGRLFDAVSALAGVRHTATYEGQAAIELEQAIEPESGSYRGEIYRGDKTWIVDSFPMIREVVADRRRGCSPGIIAARFHNGLADLLVEAACKAGAHSGLGRIVLSGGVFQNVYLLDRLVRSLEKSGFEVWSHLEVPANDACIALGQAHIGGQWLEEGAGE